MCPEMCMLEPDGQGPPGCCASPHVPPPSLGEAPWRRETPFRGKERKQEGEQQGGSSRQPCEEEPLAIFPLRGRRSPAEKLRALYGSEPHVFRLEHCRDEHSAYTSLVDNLEDSCRTRQNEMYQLLAMFALIQGVVFAAVAQSTILNCRHRFLPISLSFITSLATILALFRELVGIGQLHEEVQRNKDRADAAYGMLERIKLKGVEFDLSLELENAYGGDNISPWRHVFSAYGMSLLAFLLLVSVGIMASSAMVLCRECRCN